MGSQAEWASRRWPAALRALLSVPLRGVFNPILPHLLFVMLGMPMLGTFQVLTPD